MDDQSMIALYFARDERAISETRKTYGHYIMTIAMNILCREPDAEECVSDTYLKAWNSIPPTRPHSLKAFLARIVRNLSLNRLRDRKNADLTLSFEELEDCIPVTDEQESEVPGLIDAYLRTLSDLDRRLFLGRYWYSYPIPKLAAAYGLTSNAVTIRLSRTRAALRVYLEERGYHV